MDAILADGSKTMFEAYKAVLGIKFPKFEYDKIEDRDIQKALECDNAMLSSVGTDNLKYRLLDYDDLAKLISQEIQGLPNEIDWIWYLTKNEQEVYALYLNKSVLQYIIKHKDKIPYSVDKLEEKLNYIDQILTKYNPDLRMIQDGDFARNIYLDKFKKDLDAAKNKNKDGQYSKEDVFIAYRKNRLDIDRSQVDRSLFAYKNIANVALGDEELESIVKDPDWIDYAKTLDYKIVSLLSDRNEYSRLLTSMNKRHESLEQFKYKAMLRVADYCIALYKDSIVAKWKSYKADNVKKVDEDIVKEQEALKQEEELKQKAEQAREVEEARKAKEAQKAEEERKAEAQKLVQERNGTVRKGKWDRIKENKEKFKEKEEERRTNEGAQNQEFDDKNKTAADKINKSNNLDEAYKAIIELNYENDILSKRKNRTFLGNLMLMESWLSSTKLSRRELKSLLWDKRMFWEKIKGYSQNTFLNEDWWIDMLVDRQDKLVRLLLQKMLIENILQQKDEATFPLDAYQQKLHYLDAIIDIYQPDLRIFREQPFALHTEEYDAKEYLKSKYNVEEKYSLDEVFEAFKKYNLSGKPLSDSDKIASKIDVRKSTFSIEELNEMVKSPYWEDYQKRIDPRILFILRLRMWAVGQMTATEPKIKDEQDYIVQESYGAYMTYMRQMNLCDYCLMLLKDNILTDWKNYRNLLLPIEEPQEKKRKEKISKIIKKYPMDPPMDGKLEEKDTLSIFYSRMAALLGEESFLQENATTGEYKNLEEVKKEIDLVQEKGKYDADWPIELVKKAMNIHCLDNLFGIKRQRRDFLTSVEIKKSNENKDALFSYKDIVACKAEEGRYFRDTLKTTALDGEFATKLFNLNIDEYKELFKGMSEQNLEFIKNNIKLMQEKISNNEITLVDKEMYDDNSRIKAISELIYEDLDFYVGLYSVDDMLKDEEFVKKEVIVNRETFPTESKLREWLKTNSSVKTGITEDFKTVIEKANEFYKKVDEGKWTGKKYHLAFSEMAKAVHKWAGNSKKDAVEIGLCQQFLEIYEKTYGQNKLDPKDGGLEKIIEACKQEDDQAAIYFDAIFMSKYDKKLKEETDSDAKAKLEKEREENRKKLYEDQSFVPLFSHKPCIEDIQQGNLGDCYLLSAIAAIVKNNPDDITSMMEDFGSLVKVTFGDQSVYVSKKICSYGSAKNVLWVQIMEKAFAKAFGKKFSKSETWQKYMEYVQFVDKNRLNGDDPTKFLKEAYWSTTKVIGGGGHSHEALNSLLGLKHSKAIYSEIVTADSRSSAYSNVWKLAKNIRDKEKAIKPELKEFLIDYLKDRLWKELQSRQRLAIKEATKARRAITIDDLKDILLDIKNWKNQNGLSVYNMLFLQARLKFSDITEEEMLKHINHLANKFMEVGQLQPYDENNLQYKANLNSNNALYTPMAKETFKTIKEAVDKKLEIGVGSERFAQYEKGAVEKDANYNAGIVMAHAYTIVDCFEENGHSYINLRNTWGRGRLNYIKKIGADGKEKIIAGIKQTKDKNHGTFNIELNDFMNSFSKIYVVDAYERSQQKLIKVKQQEAKEKAKKAEEQKKAEKLKKLGEILNASESLDEAYSTIPKLDYESSTSLSTKDSKLKFLMDFDRQISEKVEDKDLGEWVILMRSNLEEIKGYSKNEFLTLNYWCRLLAKRQPKLLKLLLEKMIIEDILQYEEAKDDSFDKYRDRLQFLDAIMDKFKPDLSLFKDRQNMVSVFADDAKEYLESKKDKRGRLSAKSIYEAFEKFDTSDIKDSDKIAFEDDTEKVNLGSADLNEMVKSPYWKVYVKSMDPQFLALLRKRNFLHQQSLKMVKSIRNKDKTYNQDNYGQFQKLRTQRELCDYCIGLLKKEILINFNWRMKLDSEESADKLK